ncbi:Gfo/Idh/MocA family protein [Vibrio cyclitrophicus]|uniref:Gfo/Idh/MocA family protein n=1 Tax=Vibrio cyclitrophicus TaxID=47951 RepID=UPI0011B614DC|nr:Gfo/Idh/MocA family oxidoreductase [Vibrio cyclitrophicus]
MNRSVLKVLTVGTGYFSQFHYDAWQRVEGAKVVAICDTDLACAQIVAKQYQIAQCGADLDELIRAVQPDIIDIITPPESHQALVSIAISHGKDVIVQKPFGGSYKTAGVLATMAQNAGTQLIVHENFRFMPWYRQIRSMIDDGAVGQLLNVRFDFRPGDGQGEEAYLARQPYFQKMDKFLVHETAIHYIDVFRYLFGEVEHVYAHLRRCNGVIKGEDSGMLVFGMKDGLQAVFDGNRLLDHQAKDKRKTLGNMLLEGTLGSIRLDGDARLWLRKFNELGEEKVYYDWKDAQFGGDCVYNLIEHVVSHYHQGTEIENSAADYLRNLAIEDAVYCSNKEKRRIDV